MKRKHPRPEVEFGYPTTYLMRISVTLTGPHMPNLVTNVRSFRLQKTLIGIYHLFSYTVVNVSSLCILYQSIKTRQSYSSLHRIHYLRSDSIRWQSSNTVYLRCELCPFIAITPRLLLTQFSNTYLGFNQ